MHDALEAFNQGVLFTHEQQYEHAVEAFTEAISLDSELAKAYNARGAVRALLGDTDKGISDCNEAIRLDSGNGLFYRTRGLIRREMGDEPKAEIDLSKADELEGTPE